MTERNCRADTKACYPYKITLEEFVDEIKNHVDTFYDNMVRLRNKDKYDLNSNWAEDWMDVFSGWMEMEHKE